MDAYAAGAYGRAEEEFRAAVGHDPGMADAWLGLHALRSEAATALLAMYRHRERFGEQRRRHRRPLSSWYWLGWWVQPVLENERDLALAHASHWLDGRHLADLDRALTQCPAPERDPAVRFLHACRSYLVKDWEQLIRDTDGLLDDALLGIEAGLFNGMARVRLDMWGQAELPLAASLARCRSEQPQRKELRYWLGRAYEGGGRSAAALSLYRAVHRVDPAFMDTAARLAAITAEDGADPELLDQAAGADGAAGATGAASRLPRPKHAAGPGSSGGGGGSGGFDSLLDSPYEPQVDALEAGESGSAGPADADLCEPGGAEPDEGPDYAASGSGTGSGPGSDFGGDDPAGAVDLSDFGGPGDLADAVDAVLDGGPADRGDRADRTGTGTGYPLAPWPWQGPDGSGGAGGSGDTDLPAPLLPVGPTTAGSDFAEEDVGDGRTAGRRPDRAYLDAVLAELEGMVGMEPVKRQVRALSAQLRMARLRADQGLPVQPPKRHFVFSGPSGTGKTTVARILGRVFHALGLLSGDHLVEAQRADLVGEFLGQTAVKANELIDSALDGVLFIDEAYSLANSGYSKGDAYGDEALQVLLKRAEDNRDRLVIILAGYPEGMSRLLLSNPGLNSRFTTRVDFPSYRPSELSAIGASLAGRDGDRWDPDAQEELESICRHVVGEGWIDDLGNGRFIRTLYEKSCAYRDLRLSALPSLPDREDLATLRLPDVVQAYGELIANRGDTTPGS
ncbi:AAA family ATPase [Phaeacidiphilus oryzae]|uniref:AAA family ATPase n=1 Tax=Phaeacidiphilus oryzae TaxID=348818 RepID=UPI000A064DCB|nr:AAA family ATPase [Phaeacidiphilus oryzae]